MEVRESLSAIEQLNGDLRGWDELCLALAQRAGIVPVVGSAVSARAGLPAWSDFLRLTASRAQLDSEHVNELLRTGGFGQLAAELEDQLGTPGFQNAIELAFSTNAQPTEEHHALVALADGAILTTNVDDLLERAASLGDNYFATHRLTVRDISSKQWWESFPWADRSIVKISEGVRRAPNQSPGGRPPLSISPDVFRPSFLFVGHSIRPRDPLVRTLVASKRSRQVSDFALLPKGFREDGYERYVRQSGLTAIWYPFDPPGHLVNLLSALRKVRDRTSSLQHAFFLDDNGHLRYLQVVEYAPARIQLVQASGSSLMVGPLVRTVRATWQALIDEFERLLNSSSVSESELQHFFEAHPRFLMGTDYDDWRSQVTLHHPGDRRLRPDFILKPVGGTDLDARILDLKLPGQQLIVYEKQRPTLASQIIRAKVQLEDYGRWFQEREHRERIASRLGFPAYRPTLTVIVGRRFPEIDPVVKADLIRGLYPVELQTYEHILQRAIQMGPALA